MATLRFNNIQKIYPNHVQAVFDFNLEIKDKEFIVFVGPSGCGKSTTLRMVAGLEDISDGELYIDNKLVNFVDPKERNIAMVFQSYALYPHMTVYDNIGFSLKIRKMDKKIFAQNEERDTVEKEISALRRQLMNVVKKGSKNHKKREECEAAAEELKIKIKEKFEQLHKLEETTRGISELLVKRSKKLIATTANEIKELNKKIASGENEVSNLKLKLEEATNAPEKDEKQIKKLNNTLNMDTHILNSLRIELSSKEKEHEQAEKDFEYYSNNEVELIKYRHSTKNEIFEEVIRASEILDLFKYLYRKPAALSGGQRQRVALGRAIVRKPKVFLMDEPLSNLDAKLRTQTRTEIAHIHKEVGATTIYVTHDQVEALTLADRIVIMKDGVIQQVCTPKVAYENPANMFVAGFIGSPSTNFLTGVFNGKELVVNNKDNVFSIKLNANIVKTLKDYKDKEVVIGIRPEFMHLKKEYRGDSEVATVKLSFNDLELVGHEFIVYFDINGSKLSAKTSSQADLKVGEEYEFVIELDKVHMFDKDTTMTII